MLIFRLKVTHTTLHDFRQFSADTQCSGDTRSLYSSQGCNAKRNRHQPKHPVREGTTERREWLPSKSWGIHRFSKRRLLIYGKYMPRITKRTISWRSCRERKSDRSASCHKQHLGPNQSNSSTYPCTRWWSIRPQRTLRKRKCSRIYLLIFFRFYDLGVIIELTKYLSTTGQ